MDSANPLRDPPPPPSKRPTVFVFLLTVLALLALLGVCVAGILFVPAFGYIWWTFSAVAAILTWLVFGLRRKPRPDPLALTGRRRWFRRIVRGGRLVFITVLACWLGLILWLAWCPGGAAPPAKVSPDLIRVITWNVHCGQSDGPPWKQFDWPRRKHALRSAVQQAAPDILCVQEATPEQVAFLEETLPGHRRVGVGRDDGKSRGEHCAIYFDRKRFEEIGAATFWLEEPIDQPRDGSMFDIKRICSWVRLRDRVSGRTLRVYNTHLYLTEAPRLTAAKIILAHIAGGDRTDAILLTADFNASPSAPSRRLFVESGLADSAERAGKPIGTATFHLYGIGVWCIDGILVDPTWTVHDHRILDVKPENVFPSDHFGLMADLALPGS